MRTDTDCSVDPSSEDLSSGARFVVHSPMLVMKSLIGGRFVSLNTGISGEIVETYKESGGRGLVIISVNGEHFLAWRRDLAERADIVLRVPIVTGAVPQVAAESEESAHAVTSEVVQLRLRANLELARQRLLQTTSELHAAILAFPARLSSSEPVQTLEHLGSEHGQAMQEFLSSAHKLMLVSSRPDEKSPQKRAVSQGA